MGQAIDGLSLRETAERVGLKIGAAVKLPDPRRPTPQAYWDVLRGQFNTVVAENAMKPQWTQPERGRFDFSAAQPMVDFAAEHGLAVRGHTLAWHLGLPRWMKRLDAAADPVADLLRAHVHGVADRYHGKVFAWDVINEVFDKEDERGAGAIRSGIRPWATTCCRASFAGPTSTPRTPSCSTTITASRSPGGSSTPPSPRCVGCKTLASRCTASGCRRTTPSTTPRPRRSSPT